MVTLSINYPLNYYPGVDSLLISKAARFRGRMIRNSFKKNKRSVFIQFPRPELSREFAEVMKSSVDALSLEMRKAT